MTTVSTWQPASMMDGDAAFPDRTFLQLLFGYRDLAHLRHAFADCSARGPEAAALLEALFPPQPSSIWFVGWDSALEKARYQGAHYTFIDGHAK
jgi:prepilin-type processing-associated H-X9-DG protein